MAWTLSDPSNHELAQVLADFSQKTPEDPTPAQCEKLGRMLIAMYRNRAHPVRMFHLISQVTESAPTSPDMETLTTLAWALAEVGPTALSEPDDAGVN